MIEEFKIYVVNLKRDNARRKNIINEIVKKKPQHESVMLGKTFLSIDHTLKIVNYRFILQK